MPAIFTVEIAIKRKNKTAAMVRLDGCSYHILQITNKNMYKIKPTTSNAEIQTKSADTTSGIPVFGR